MNQQKLLMLTLGLALIGGTAVALTQLPKRQRLGAPGVMTRPLAGSNRLEVLLPEQVPGYDSQWQEPDEVTLNTLPKDTSFGCRLYTAKDPADFWVRMQVVLMGNDRSSLHKPQFCLTGSGWNIDPAASVEISVHMDQPCSYDLPVVKLIATKEAMDNGEKRVARGVYIYWFVADDALSASVTGFQRNWLIAKTLLRTGVLQRWAYVSCFSVCAPGQEDATFERMTKFIAASVPQFQMMPRGPVATASTRP
ncbi:MAG TPA: exosortase-associated EpsI family protein [Candidatus Acidoferrum sp.]|jgi:hypothetical protein|nr:exosortase-associated EpsI family protein [Candidatus Acidoferrum sp.]